MADIPIVCIRDLTVPCFVLPHITHAATGIEALEVCRDMARTGRFLAPLTVMVLLLASAAAMLPPKQVLAADDWSITIPANAGSDGSNPALQFGTRSGATDGFDAGGVDVPSAPPAPDATFRAFFQIAAPILPQLNVDYRDMLPAAPGSTVAWSLKIQSHSQPIHLSWSDPAVAGVPLDTSLTLSGGGQTIDMRSTTSATYPSGTLALTITAARLTAPSTVPVDDDELTPDVPGEDAVDDDDSAIDGRREEATNGDVPAADSSSEGAAGNARLNIVPAQVLPNQEVTIFASICNTGAEHDTRTVSLMVNGVAEQSQPITVSGGSCQQITFTLSRTTPGIYEIAIDDMVGQFSVLGPGTITNTPAPQQQSGLVTAGIIAIIAVMVALIAALIIAFRRT
jgi:hypothetical protein